MTERSTLFLLQEKTKIIGELQRDNEEYEALVETLSKQNADLKGELDQLLNRATSTETEAEMRKLRSQNADLLHDKEDLSDTMEYLTQELQQLRERDDEGSKTRQSLQERASVAEKDASEWKIEAHRLKDAKLGLENQLVELKTLLHGMKPRLQAAEEQVKLLERQRQEDLSLIARQRLEISRQYSQDKVDHVQEEEEEEKEKEEKKGVNVNVTVEDQGKDPNQNKLHPIPLSDTMHARITSLLSQLKNILPVADIYKDAVQDSLWDSLEMHVSKLGQDYRALQLASKETVTSSVQAEKLLSICWDALHQLDDATVHLVKDIEGQCNYLVTLSTQLQGSNPADAPSENENDSAADVDSPISNAKYRFSVVTKQLQSLRMKIPEEEQLFLLPSSYHENQLQQLSERLTSWSNSMHARFDNVAGQCSSLIKGISVVMSALHEGRRYSLLEAGAPASRDNDKDCMPDPVSEDTVTSMTAGKEGGDIESVESLQEKIVHLEAMLMDSVVGRSELSQMVEQLQQTGAEELKALRTTAASQLEHMRLLVERLKGRDVLLARVEEICGESEDALVVHVQELKDSVVKDQIARSNSELSMNSLSEEKAQLEASNLHMQEHISSLQREMSVVRNERDDLRRDIERSVQDSASLKRELALFTQKASSTEKLQQQIRSLEEELAAREPIISQWEPSENFKSQLAMIEDDLKRQDLHAKYAKSFKYIKEEVLRLSGALSKARRNLDDASQSVVVTTAKLEEISKERDDLKTKVTTLHKKMHDLQDQSKRLAATSDGTNTKIQMLKEIRDSTKNQSEKFRKAAKKLELQL